ncbi:MAG TPA: aldehyde dehydrogenase family protein, partial [bacterium]|nr:aldehyde dehydrogenase family protein [bacterium]
MADLARAVFSFSGQRCTAPRRIIVVADVFDSFCEKFTAAVCALRIGDPSDLRTQIGPLISKERQALMEQQVQAAISAGARLLAGGNIPERFP